MRTFGGLARPDYTSNNDEVGWTWPEIRDDWLGDGKIAPSPAEVVEAFNLVERRFGRQWIEQSRQTPAGSFSQGSLSVVHILYTAELLATLEGVEGGDRIVQKLRDNDPSAMGEAIAAWLVRQGADDAVIAYEPSVAVGTTTRNPDYRVRRASDPWTYIEVASPQESEAEQRVGDVLGAFQGVLDEVPGSYGIEVFFDRPPDPNDLGDIREFVLDAARSDKDVVRELPDGLGLVVRNIDHPGRIELPDHGRDYVPRLGQGHVRLDDSGHRHLVVRVPFEDERARDFLRKKARQLPSEAPGVIMFNMSGASGGWELWEDILRKALHPGQHTRVSGIVMFDSGVATEDGQSQPRIKAKVVENPNSRFEMEPWLAGIDGEYRI